MNVAPFYNADVYIITESRNKFNDVTETSVQVRARVKIENSPSSDVNGIGTHTIYLSEPIDPTAKIKIGASGQKRRIKNYKEITGVNGLIHVKLTV